MIPRKHNDPIGSVIALYALVDDRKDLLIKAKPIFDIESKRDWFTVRPIEDIVEWHQRLAFVPHIGQLCASDLVKSPAVGNEIVMVEQRIAVG